MVNKKSTKAKKEKSIEEIMPKTPKSEKDIAMDFAIAVHKKFDRLVKASVLFGSQAKNTASASSDIDIILVIDDASINWDLEMVSWYREELAKLVGNFDSSKELHINTIKLTTWWQDLLYGDPVILNVLRYGEALIDSGGFFNPIKALLLQGKIHSTPEAVYAALQRVPEHLSRSRNSELNAIEGVYWAIIDSSQAALITAGKLPPSPEHIPLLLEETFVDQGLLKQEFVNYMKEVYSLHKSILHGETKKIEGSMIDRWQQVAEKYMLEMTRIINTLLEQNQVKKN
jgi:predicted nucleotidyltransferase/uncharacterized protein (UPF0332 family)